MHARSEPLAIIWDRFEHLILTIPNLNLENLTDIKKLMTAEFVVDISSHEIYRHTAFVHELTHGIIKLKHEFPEAHLLWLELLSARKQQPLKVRHHQHLDGECDFRFSLQLMEGKPCGFREIQVLKSADNAEALIHEMHQLDCLAFGMSFGELPIVNNNVLVSLMNFKDAIFLIARDQSNQYIGHRWGVILRDVELDKQHKGNIFWSMETVRHPDFHDETVNVGAALREQMFQMLKERNDCDFIAYQHRLNHKFHMTIVGNQAGDEFVACNNEIFDAKSSIHYDSDLSLFMRAQFIRSNNCTLPFPEYASIRTAILKSFWQARRSTFDFAVGGLTFFKRNSNQKSHNMLESPMEHRLLEKVSPEKDACDTTLLQQILQSDECAVLKLLSNSEFNFSEIKATIMANKKPIKNPAAALLCDAIKNADTPTFAIDHLLQSKDIPIAWLNSIHQQRNTLIKAADVSGYSARHAHSSPKNRLLNTL